MAHKDLKKGQKQINKENAENLQFYLYIILGVLVIYAVVSFLFLELRWSIYVGFFIPSFIYAGAYKFLSSMVSGGMDLAMEGGMAEHAKDLLLVTAIIQLLSLISNYLWLLWLVVPGRAFYMLWVNLLAPWFFAPPPPEMDEKQQKKHERKMKRQIVYK